MNLKYIFIIISFLFFVIISSCKFEEEELVESKTNDTKSPTIAEVNRIPTHTNDNTPTYTFISTEDGEIIYSGSCSSQKEYAFEGNNTLIFNTLNDGLYEDCTLEVIDNSGNKSNKIVISKFVIDTVKPEINAFSPSNGSTKIGINQSVYVQFSEEMDEDTLNDRSFYISSGDGNILTTLKYSNSVGRLEPSSSLSENTFYTIHLKNSICDYAMNCISEQTSSFSTGDFTSPIIYEETPITNPTNRNTPSYVFYSSESGEINYSGSCKGIQKNAKKGSNLIIMNSLEDGIYSNCKISITDNSSNSSNTLFLNEFRIDTIEPFITDVTPIDNSTSISLDTKFKIIFSEEIDKESVVLDNSSKSCSDSIQISKDNFVTCLIIKESNFSSSNKEIIITLLENLSHSSNYKIKIYNNIIDLASNNLNKIFLQSNGFFTVSDPRSISLGGAHSCLILEDNSVKCWGENEFGQVGTKDIHHNKCWACDNTSIWKPTLVEGNLKAKSIAAGGISSLWGWQGYPFKSDHTCAVDLDGDVYCWGYNTSGQLGNKDNKTSFIPVKVSGIKNINQITSGAKHSCALNNAGEVYCWGEGTNGQLGNGLSDNQSSPVKVINLDNNTVQIIAGGESTCTLNNSGEVFCWGSNRWRQLGFYESFVKSYNSPQKIDNITNIKQISMGDNYACVLSNNGDIKCWGCESSGQLGNGIDNSYYCKADHQEVVGITNAIFIESGHSHSCAILENKKIKCWGENNYGQLGIDNTSDQSTPVLLESLYDISSISCGGDHTCAISKNKLYCWGDGTVGQLGTEKWIYKQEHPIQISY